jgi:hypothetical protein
MNWRLTAARKFMVNYGFNPTTLLHVDWMSDEDSEPEGYSICETEAEKTKTMAEWRKNSLHRLGITGDLEPHDDVGLLEVVQPEWRSEYVSVRSGQETYHSHRNVRGVGRVARTQPHSLYGSYSI